MSDILIIGATRGLGASLAALYSTQANTTVFGTTRAAEGPGDASVTWIPHIDLMSRDVGTTLVQQLILAGSLKPFAAVIITAGYFTTESWDEGPKWEEEVKMYTTSAISLPTIVHALFNAKYLTTGSKVVIVSSESGSITLRDPKEGGGNYAHHASKAASNMVGRLLSLDLKSEGIVVSIVHPGFMRTEMTKGVGFDKYWDDGGAVTPDEAAVTLMEWTDQLDMSKTGQYWAPRGPRDIGTSHVMGEHLPTPLQLPW